MKKWIPCLNRILEKKKEDFHPLGVSVDLQDIHAHFVRECDFDVSCYRKHKDSLASLLSEHVKVEVETARLLGFNRSIERTLLKDGIPLEVYDMLIHVMREFAPSMEKYTTFSYRLEGLLKKSEGFEVAPISYEEAVDILIAAFEPLGKTYVTDISRALKEQAWVDVYPTASKTKGWRTMGDYSTHPYILANYDNSTERVFSLAHELGHGMKFFYQNKNQLICVGQPSLAIGEIASTFNEGLLFRYLMTQKKDGSDFEKAVLIDNWLNKILINLRDQMIDVEAERDMHEREERSRPLTAAFFSSLYHRLVNDYFNSTLSTGDWVYEILGNAGLLNSFRSYAYPFSVSLAISVLDGVYAEYITNPNGVPSEKKSLTAYLDFLKNGASRKTVDVLSDLGINLHTPTRQLFASVLKHFTELTEELGAIVARLERAGKEGKRTNNEL